MTYLITEEQQQLREIVQQIKQIVQQICQELVERSKKSQIYIGGKTYF